MEETRPLCYIETEFNCQGTRSLTPTSVWSTSPSGETVTEAAPPQDESLEDLILNQLEDDKAQDIVVIDLEGKSPVTDTMIIASGRSHRHVSALADHVLRALKNAGAGNAKVEGLQAGDWVLIDAGDVIVHLFRPEVREFYNLEKLWSVRPSSAAAD